jgi:hypothetical protein
VEVVNPMTRAELDDILSHTMFDDIATAARAHNVMISITVTPYEESAEVSVRDPNDGTAGVASAT